MGIDREVMIHLDTFKHNVDITLGDNVEVPLTDLEALLRCSSNTIIYYSSANQSY